MAETLAILYWKAHVDANDIEFVLAPPSSTPSTSQPVVLRSQYLGDHALWVLDFYCCKSMSMDEGGVQQAVDAFYGNDRYYPRPGSGNERDQRVWECFRDRFIEAGEDLLEPGSPEAFVVGGAGRAETNLPMTCTSFILGKQSGCMFEQLVQ